MLKTCLVFDGRDVQRPLVVSRSQCGGSAASEALVGIAGVLEAVAELLADYQWRDRTLWKKRAPPTCTYQKHLVSDLPPALLEQMRQKAVARALTHHTEPSANGTPDADSPCALAIEPDADQARVLEEALGGRIGGRLVVVQSTTEACATFADTIPNLILMSPLLAPVDEEQIVAHLATLGDDASHVRLLAIPRFGDGSGQPEKKWRFGRSAKKSSAGGCDPAEFASEIAESLAQGPVPRPRRPELVPTAPVEDDTLADLRIEHIEQMLDRLDVDRAPAKAPSPETETVSPHVTEQSDMSTPSRHEVALDTPREAGEARIPRFLIPDEHVPLPLRALLEEADGCLKMSFLTGAGACAGRTLDLLLAEQGLGGGDRSDQILQLGKKHPAVAESFLRGLQLVTNNPSGAWDEARVTLAIGILKAIVYEIYVLGPERKERAAYVIDLLERFKAAGRN